MINSFINPVDGTLWSAHLLDPLKQMITRVCKKYTQITPAELFERPVIYRLLLLRPELKRQTAVFLSLFARFDGSDFLDALALLVNQFLDKVKQRDLKVAEVNKFFIAR